MFTHRPFVTFALILAAVFLLVACESPECKLSEDGSVDRSVLCDDRNLDTSAERGNSQGAVKMNFRNTPAPTTEPTVSHTNTPAQNAATPIPTQEVAKASPAEVQHTPLPTPSHTPQPTPTLGHVALPPKDIRTIPHVFVGSVTIDGQVAVDGTEVSAWVSDYSSAVGLSNVANGSYVMNVSQYGTASFSGMTLIFKIGSVETALTSTWETGGATVLDLVTD